MPACLEIFVSAASNDLRSSRQIVRDVLLARGCLPVTQDLLAPSARTARDLLRGKISCCHAVIHLVGESYGAEPSVRDPAAPRRSYTQLEYDLARELKKPVYSLLCADDYPYDIHEPQSEEERALQEAHRARIGSLNNRKPETGPLHDIAVLRDRVERLTARLQRMHFNWTKIVPLPLLYLVWRGIGLYHGHDNNRSEEQSSMVLVQQFADQYGKNIARGNAPTDEQKHAAVVAGIARQQGLPPATVQRRIEWFVARIEGGTDDDFYKRALAEFVEKRFSDAARDAARDAAACADEPGGDAAALHEEAQHAWRLAGDALHALGQYADAAQMFQQALALCNQTKFPLLWCEIAHDLAETLKLQRRYAEAEPLARAALEQRTALQGPEHAATLQEMDGLADLLLTKADFPGAEPLCRQLLDVRERTLGSDDPRTLATRNNLALALFSEDKFKEAEPLLRQSLDEETHRQGWDDAATVNVLTYLGTVLYRMGNLEDAEASFRRALASWERTAGPESPGALRCLNALGLVLRSRGDLKGAEPLLRRALASQEYTAGKENLEAPDVMNNLALVLNDQGDYAGAEPFFRRALEAKMKAKGNEDLEVLNVTNNLALLLYHKGDLAGAAAMERSVLEIQERVLGKEAPATLLTVGNLGLFAAGQGDAVAAEAFYRRALEARERILGKTDASTAMTAFNFSVFQAGQGKLPEALALAEEAAAGAQASLPPDDHSRVAYERHFHHVRDLVAKEQLHPAPAVKSTPAAGKPRR